MKLSERLKRMNRHDLADYIGSKMTKCKNRDKVFRFLSLKQLLDKGEIGIGLIVEDLLKLLKER